MTYPFTPFFIISIIFGGLSLLGLPAVGLSADIPVISVEGVVCPFNQCDRKILGDNNLEPIINTINTDTVIYDLAQATARLERQSDGLGLCTASRISERLFLTNFHCAKPCETIRFTMGFEQSNDRTQRLSFKCERFLYKNQTLDYSLYEATASHPPQENENIPTPDYPSLKLWNGPLFDGQSVFMPSHPSGRMLEVDRSPACVISSATLFHTESGRDTIKHMCDSEVGSSGAPLIDRDAGAIVALHWGGRDGEYNMAIPMSLIVADLKAHLDPAVFGMLTIVSDAAERP